LLTLKSSSDTGIRFLAMSNLLSTKPPENPFLLYRDYHSVPKPMKKDAPFHYQANIIKQNDLVLELLCQKFDSVISSTSQPLPVDKSPTAASLSLSVLNAAAHARNEINREAIKRLNKLLTKRPSDIGLLLTIVQLYILTNNASTAAELLHDFYSRVEESKSHLAAYTPALVATAVTLFTSQGRASNARSILSQAAHYWRSQRSSKNPPKALLRAAAAAWLESQADDDEEEEESLQDALDIFQHLHDSDPSDRANIAGLVAATAAMDPSKLDKALLDQLTPAPQLVSGIDAEALEDAGVARPVDVGPATGSKRSADDIGKPKPATKRKKKLPPSRQPKDFVEGKKMDPERWLPMRDRSYFRPKGKKGKGRAMVGLTQGGVVDENRDKGESTVKSSGGGKKGKKTTKW
jgi:signal recognition particle subunit SRP72